MNYYEKVQKTVAYLVNHYCMGTRFAEDVEQRFKEELDRENRATRFEDQDIPYSVMLRTFFPHTYKDLFTHYIGSKNYTTISDYGDGVKYTNNQALVEAASAYLDAVTSGVELNDSYVEIAKLMMVEYNVDSNKLLKEYVK